jgi:hypothetical protein
MYLGIDESNHGLSPEIFVGCITSSYEEVKEERKSLSKIRGAPYSRWKDLLDVNYKHIIFGWEFREIDPTDYKIIAIGEFARNFSEQFKIRQIFMDGNIKKSQLERIMNILAFVDKDIRLSFGKDLDRKISLVNKADNVANLLFHEYVKNKGREKDKYEKYLIKPDLKDYERFL